MAANPFDNPDFRDELKDLLKEMISPITDTQKQHGLRLDGHDAKFNRQAGGFVVLGIIGGFIEAMLHWKWGK